MSRIAMVGLSAATALAVLATAVPIGVPKATSAAAWTAAKPNPGNSFSTAATWSYDLYSWGYAASGRTGAQITSSSTTTSVRTPGPEAWASVAAGDQSTCAITTGGDLYCWGQNSYGQLGNGNSTDQREPVQVAAGTTWSAVSKGYVNTCAIKAADQTLWCWGYNPNGQVGNNTTASPVLSPTQVSTTGLSTWSSVSLGQYFACGLKTDRTLWCWGYGANGRLGNNATTNLIVPTQVGSDTWSSLSTSRQSTCAIKYSTSALWCWGNAFNGQLGNGTTTPDVDVPTASISGTWSSVSGGEDMFCALKTNSTIWCWGDAVNGGLGHNSTTDSSTPVQENSANSSWTAVRASSHGPCATRSTGALYCWGENNDGQLGVTGSTTDSLVPVASGSATDWTALSGGDEHFCGVRSADSGLWCQGDNLYGKLGHDYNDRVGAPTPLSPPNATWDSGSTGYEGGCGVRIDGTLWCWGDNSQGQAGANDLIDHPYPQQAGVATDWASVSVGSWTACGVRTGGSLYCWGDGGYGQLGTVSTTDVKVPTSGPAGTWSRVSVGETHSCAVSTAGAMSCWGQNGDGQLGDNTTTNSNTPVSVTATTGVTTWGYVSAGYYGTCAIAATGAQAGGLFCWGRNSQGQVGIGSTTSPQRVPVQVGSSTWSSVEVGRGTVCGVRTTGALYCWGLNDYGQLGQGGTAGTPSQLTSPTAVGALTTWSDVAAGWGTSCATKVDSTLWCWGRDDDGQLGDRGSTTVTSPQQVPGLSATSVEAHTGSLTVLAWS